MNSEARPDGQGQAAYTEIPDDAGDLKSPPVVCSVCQQPLDDDQHNEWRGEPMHEDCTAELRCGIYLGGYPAE